MNKTLDGLGAYFYSVSVYDPESLNELLYTHSELFTEKEFSDILAECSLESTRRDIDYYRRECKEYEGTEFEDIIECPKLFGFTGNLSFLQKMKDKGFSKFTEHVSFSVEFGADLIKDNMDVPEKERDFINKSLSLLERESK